MGDETDSQKKVAKKKHYPFGTPSHLHPPFSEFAHLPAATRNFAIALATATDVKPEVIEEAPPSPSQQRRRLPSPQKKKKKSKGEDDEEDEEDDEEEDDILSSASGLQPCTKIPCQMVIRSIADLQYKNQIERLDIEDEFDRLTVDLRQTEEEITQSESRLDKLTDIGNQLEIKLNQIMSKVESLEKNKENLQTERTDINTKLMLLEVERQKANRRLEKAQKELTNARWKKKKQAQAQDAEAGISLPVSEISESKIIHRDTSFVSKMSDVFQTEKNQLARERVVDYIERPPTVKTVPVFLQDKYFNGSGATSAQLDKYAKAHYKTLIDDSLESWKQLEGMVVASSMDPFEPLKRVVQSTVPPKRVSTVTMKRLTQSQSLADAKEFIGGATTGHRMVGNALSKSLSQSSFGGTGTIDLASLTCPVTKKSPKKPSLQSVSTVHILEEVHSLMDFASATGGTNPAKSRVGTSSSSGRESAGDGRRAGGGRSRAGFSQSLSRSSSIRLSPIDHNSNSGSPLALGGQLESMSTAHDDHYYQQHAAAEKQMQEYIEKLAEDGIYAHMAFPKLSINDVPINPEQSPQPKKKLDTVFFKNHDQEHWGRSSKLGKVRTRHLQESEILKEVGHSRKKQIDEDEKKPRSSVNRNGMVLLDTRALPKVTSRTLTIKHPGMSCFNDSMSSVEGF